VAEAVDVGGIGVDVLPERVRVLHQETERLRIVWWAESPRGGERLGQVLAAGTACRIARARADDHRLEDGLQALLGLVNASRLRHAGSSA
jgi:hypothetical protein